MPNYFLKRLSSSLLHCSKLHKNLSNWLLSRDYSSVDGCNQEKDAVDYIEKNRELNSLSIIKREKENENACMIIVEISHFLLFILHLSSEKKWLMAGMISGGRVRRNLRRPCSEYFSPSSPLSSTPDLR